MVEKFLNDTFDYLENMAGKKHVLGVVFFYIIYFNLMCLLYDIYCL